MLNAHDFKKSRIYCPLASIETPRFAEIPHVHLLS